MNDIIDIQIQYHEMYDLSSLSHEHLIIYFRNTKYNILKKDKNLDKV